MSAGKFIISLPGFNADTATPEQCAVHSSFPSPKVKVDPIFQHYGKIHLTFSRELTDSVPTTLLVIPHGLGYTPAIMSVLNYTDPASPSFQAGGVMPYSPTATFTLWLAADATNIYLRVYWNPGWGSMLTSLIDITYYLFVEDGA